MRAPRERTVHLQRGPDVQLLGEAVLIQGAAALDLYNVLREGIRSVRARDCIEPNERLLQALAGLKAATAASRVSASAVTADIADVRRREVAASSLVSGEVVGMEEVARMFGVGMRQARRLAPSLGGWRGTGRGRPWSFDRATVQAYIDVRGAAS